MTTAPLNDLLNAAAKTAEALGLKRTPEVYRDAANAWAAADRVKAGTVVLGDGAFWVLCLADAARLERAGFEFAPRNQTPRRNTMARRTTMTEYHALREGA